MPPRASSADVPSPPQTPHQIATLIEAFLAAHPLTAVLEDGKVAFELATAKYELSVANDYCTLQLWNEDRNLSRRIVAATERAGSLRLATLRVGHTQTRLLELVADRERRTPTTREGARTRYLALLQRVLARQFPDEKLDGFRSSMDLEQSFGPAYARGTLLQGTRAWAVIGVNQQETAVTIDGILTPGVLWLHACREQANGRRLFQGLRLIVPRGAATLTLSRLAWMNTGAAQWELYELDEKTEELHERDVADQGNLRTRLVHHPDERAATERFAAAVAQVTSLVPADEVHRVEQRLRSTAELAFLLHGLEFARARLAFAPGSFTQTLEITVGALGSELPLTEQTRPEMTARVAELFARRRALEPEARRNPVAASSRRIGAPGAAPAHARMRLRGRGTGVSANDPLYRAQPERWLESVLRRDLAPLTRGLAPAPVQESGSQVVPAARQSPEPDPDTIGNRADPPPSEPRDGNRFDPAADAASHPASRLIPRLDPLHVYTQVPAIAGASDRGLLDLLGVTADGRLAVIELKAQEDLHFALQGLDYWIRVRHHHLQTVDEGTGLGEFQRHGYFTGVQLSPLAPRLYLVAPALHIHSATETVLRYVSPRVEWSLLALDERWRQQVRVVWRRQSNTASL